jgi:pimeloyl-ACP methyl ester carboxylesterase
VSATLDDVDLVIESFDETERDFVFGTTVGGKAHNAAADLALLEAHYFRHALFLEPNQLLRDIGRIRHIPATIVQGCYDIICPTRSAWNLSQAWPEATLHIVLAGHSAADPEILDQLVQATDRLADRFGWNGDADVRNRRSKKLWVQSCFETCPTAQSDLPWRSAIRTCSPVAHGV